MNYRIIDNLSNDENHSNILRRLFEKSDEILVASPFLMGDFTDFFIEIATSHLKKFHLITTLKPNSFEQIGKINSLISLIEFPSIKNGEIECTISINNKLHGKIYIFKSASKYLGAVISSANFTNNGLLRNHEWGVEIYDALEISKIESSLLNAVEYGSIGFEKIKEMEQDVADFLEQNPKEEVRDVNLNLMSKIEGAIVSEEVSSSMQYWLKPIGVSDDPVPENRLFNSPEEILHFSKRRPTGVKPDDILIAYAVGTTKILSVYKAKSLPAKSSEEEIQHDGKWLERWPWYIIGENLTPAYGSLWYNHEFTKNSLLQEFLNRFPDNAITAVGGKTLGALNFGQDKVKLNPMFARFIIEKIKLADNKLKHVTTN